MREWLIGMTGAAMLAAVAKCLMPPGPVRQVGGLICGMVLLWAVLRPVVGRFDVFGASLRITQQSYGVQEDLEQKQTQLLKSLIEQECGTYIVDKATDLGIDCSAVVVCGTNEAGVWLPESCRVSGQLSSQQRSELEQIISTQLGIVPERQEYVGGG